MPWGAAIVAGGALLGGAISANAQSDAAETAANAQTAASQAGIAQQKAQFEAVQKLLAPYVNAGTGALAGQQDLLGLNGAGAQRTAVGALQTSPLFTALQQQGEDAILQNASATGGLRGGNTQAALAQFRPQLLAQMINDQFSKLGGLTSIGQNAAAGTGNSGLHTGDAIAGLLGQIGQAQAGNALAQGRATVGLVNGVSQGLGAYAGYNGFGGSRSPYTSPNLFGQYSNPNTGADGSGIDQFQYLGGPSTAGDYSDVRLKEDIRPVGKTKRGHNVYSWRWKGGGGRGVGVIAQEVARTDPELISVDPAGLLKVDYRGV